MASEPDSEDPGYQFGIELEFLICLKDPRFSMFSARNVQEYFVDMWEKNMDTNVYHDLAIDKELGDKFEGWKLRREPAIDDQPYEDQENKRLYWPLEIISPIFKYHEYKYWQAQIKEVINFYEKYAFLRLTKDCGFHIHVSPTECEWKLDRLKDIAIAIMKFGNVLDALFGDKDAKYTKSNRNSNSAVKGHEIEEVAKMIADCVSPEALIDIVNPIMGQNWGRRDYSWNFTNMSGDEKQRAKPPLGTLEYRSPRATTEQTIIHKWIVFTVTFIDSSSVSKDILKEKPVRDDLDKFLNENLPPGGSDELCWEKYKNF